MFATRMRQWLRRAFHRAPSEARRYRPMLEMLEQRETPAVFLVSSAANAGAGTLRQAILDANANAGPDTIDFDLEPGGTQTINLTSALPTLTDTVTIDGRSQPGWVSSAVVTIDGSAITYPCNGLTTVADGCVFESLGIQGFADGDGIGLYSSHNIAEGLSINSVSTGIEVANLATGNVIGGTTDRDINSIFATDVGVLLAEFSAGTTIERSSIHGADGIFITAYSSQNYIGMPGLGNTIAGSTTGILIDATSANTHIQGNSISSGNVFPGNSASSGSGSHGTFGTPGSVIGIDVQGTFTTIGGTAPGAGNTIFGGSTAGILVEALSNGALIEGNRIGTDATGTTAAPNGIGIDILASGTAVGGTTTGAGNLISGNTGAGIVVEVNVIDTVIQGNKIGVTSTGTALPNATGIELFGSNNQVGGSTASARNVIAFNTQDGVFVGPNVSGVTIRANSIHDNGNLGINITAGSNHSQAAPTITLAFVTSNLLSVVGNFPDTAPTKFTIDIYASPTHATPPAYQGKVYVGSVTVMRSSVTATIPFVTTLPTTNTAFSAATPQITATVTDINGNTSEFSAAVLDPEAAAPKITSPKTASFTVTTPGSFTVMTSGFPAPVLSATGSLPRGVTFDKATGVLSGTPAVGTSGTYVLHLTARNGYGPVATQALVITVNKQITPVSTTAQVTVAPPTKATALGNGRYSVVFSITENASVMLGGKLIISGFNNLPAGLTFIASSTTGFVGKSKTLTLTAVFKKTAAAPMATLLPGLDPILEDVIA